MDAESDELTETKLRAVSTAESDFCPDCMLSFTIRDTAHPHGIVPSVASDV